MPCHSKWHEAGGCSASARAVRGWPRALLDPGAVAGCLATLGERVQRARVRAGRGGAIRAVRAVSSWLRAHLHGPLAIARALRAAGTSGWFCSLRHACWRPVRAVRAPHGVVRAVKGTTPKGAAHPGCLFCPFTQRVRARQRTSRGSPCWRAAPPRAPPRSGWPATCAWWRRPPGPGTARWQQWPAPPPTRGRG